MLVQGGWIIPFPIPNSGDNFNVDNIHFLLNFNPIIEDETCTVVSSAYTTLITFDKLAKIRNNILT